LGVFRRRAPWVALCVILAAGAAHVISRQQTKKYTATAALVFKSNRLGREIGGLRTAGNSARAEWASDIRLLRSGNSDSAAKTAAQLGRGLTPREVSTSVRVSAPREWKTVSVSATETSRRLAASVANTYTGLLLAAQRSRDHALYAAAIKRVEKKLAALSRKARAGARGSSLRNRVRSLQLFDRLRGGNARVRHAAAIPGSPSSPRLVRNTVLGGAFGLLLGLVIAAVLARLGRRMRKPEELARMYSVPLLGIVPRSNALALRSRPPGVASLEPLPRREQEAFELIRARLRYFNIDRELRTLLVASSAPGEGKTTVARNLASAAARVGSVVLLIEADLRHPALAGQLALRPGPGLADVLIGELSLWSATQLVDVDSASPASEEGPVGRSLDVLPAGFPLPPNPAELIESQAMETVLQEARSTYDLVVIDTPPLDTASDAFALSRKADGVILVGRGSRNRGRAAAGRLRARLDAAAAPLLGVIANCVNDRGPDVHEHRPYDAGPDGAHPYPIPAASAEGQSLGRQRNHFAANGSPRTSRGNGDPRAPARFRRRATGRQLRSEDDSRPTASP
jgi:capsular exopolysaccharide synthesis family protein